MFQFMATITINVFGVKVKRNFSVWKSILVEVS